MCVCVRACVCVWSAKAGSGVGCGVCANPYRTTSRWTHNYTHTHLLYHNKDKHELWWPWCTEHPYFTICCFSYKSLPTLSCSDSVGDRVKQYFSSIMTLWYYQCSVFQTTIWLFCQELAICPLTSSPGFGHMNSFFTQFQREKSEDNLGLNTGTLCTCNHDK